MKIFKNKKIDKEKYRYIDYIDKNYSILRMLNDGKTYSQIATKIKTTVPTVQYRLKKTFEEIEEIEPEITKLYSEFDTFLDLKKIIVKEWVYIIARLLVNKIPNSFQSTIDMSCIVDTKLKHLQYKKHLKNRKPYNTVTGQFLTDLSAQLPCKLEWYAKEKGINPEKFEHMINVLFFEKICLMNGWILSTRRSLFKSIILYGSDNKINYDGKLHELFNIFFTKYKKMFFDLRINSYNEFIKKLKKNMHLFKGFVMLEHNSKKYEIIQYLRKKYKNLNLSNHHLKEIK